MQDKEIGNMKKGDSPYPASLVLDLNGAGAGQCCLKRTNVLCDGEIIEYTGYVERDEWDVKLTLRAHGYNPATSTEDFNYHIYEAEITVFVTRPFTVKCAHLSSHQALERILSNRINAELSKKDACVVNEAEKEHDRIEYEEAYSGYDIVSKRAGGTHIVKVFVDKPVLRNIGTFNDVRSAKNHIDSIIRMKKEGIWYPVHAMAGKVVKTLQGRGYCMMMDNDMGWVFPDYLRDDGISAYAIVPESPDVLELICYGKSINIDFCIKHLTAEHIADTIEQELKKAGKKYEMKKIPGTYTAYLTGVPESITMSVFERDSEGVKQYTGTFNLDGKKYLMSILRTNREELEYHFAGAISSGKDGVVALTRNWPHEVINSKLNEAWEDYLVKIGKARKVKTLNGDTGAYTDEFKVNEESTESALKKGIRASPAMKKFLFDDGTMSREEASEIMAGEKYTINNSCLVGGKVTIVEWMRYPDESDKVYGVFNTDNKLEGTSFHVIAAERLAYYALP